MDALEYGYIAGPALLFVVLVEYLASRLRRQNVYTLSDTIANIYCGALERLVDLFFAVLMYFLFRAIYAWLGPLQLPSIRDLPLGAALLHWFGALIFADFLAYWHHRISHEVNALWAAHIVHHSSEELNASTVFRVSLFAVFNRAFFWIWMPVIGIHPDTAVSVVVFIGLYQFVTHTRLVKTLGWLERVVVTPSHHRVHHGRNEEYLDKNYGHVFIIWDRLFRTFAPERDEPEFGITTGLDTVNPFRIVFHYWADLIRTARRTPKWIDKLGVFVRHPRWAPSDGPVSPVRYQVGARLRRRKFKLTLPLRLRLYAVFNTGFIVSCLLILFAVKRTMVAPPVMELLTDATVMQVTAMFLLSALSFGLFVERRGWVFSYEYVRWVCVYANTVVLLRALPLPWLWLTGLTVAFVALILWVRSLRGHLRAGEAPTGTPSPDDAAGAQRRVEVGHPDSAGPVDEVDQAAVAGGGRSRMGSHSS